MRTTAATPIIVAVVGFVLIAVAVGIAFGVFIVPTSQKITEQQERFNGAYQDSLPSAQAEAKSELDANNKTAAGIRAQWDIKEKALMPPYDVSDRGLAWKQLSRELSYNLGPNLERWMARSGVIQQTSISIEAPPNSPNLISGSPLVIPITGSSGSMSVGGDFRSLLESVLKWNDFNRLVLIDRLQLHGNSPYMQAQYDAQVIIFPQHADKLGGTVEKSGTGGGGGGFGGGGGYGGGPGGPPGGLPRMSGG